MNPTVSVIVCYNKKDVLEEFIDRSLDNQDIEIEKVYLDNNTHNFKSAAEALTYGFNISKGEYIVFAHQDISFDHISFIRKTVEYVKKTEGIIGLAGKKTEDFEIYTNLKHGSLHEYAGAKRISEIEPVQTIDEVYFAMKRSTFDKLGFDASTFDNWHLYSVDLCLNALSKGIVSYVMPEEAYHLSQGNIGSSFFKEFDKMVFKYRDQFEVIASTCANTRTDQKSYISYKRKTLFQLRKAVLINSVKRYLKIKQYKM